MAQKLSEEALARSLSEARRSLARGESLTHCEDCGEPIPERRRQAVPGCTRCVACQALFERMKR